MPMLSPWEALLHMLLVSCIWGLVFLLLLWEVLYKDKEDRMTLKSLPPKWIKLFKFDQYIQTFIWTFEWPPLSDLWHGKDRQTETQTEEWNKKVVIHNLSQPNFQMFLEIWHTDIFFFLEKPDDLETAFPAYEICCKRENVSHSSFGWKFDISKHLPMEIQGRNLWMGSYLYTELITFQHFGSENIFQPKKCTNKILSPFQNIFS